MSGLETALAGMLERIHTLHPGDVAGLAEWAVAQIGGRHVEVYLADLGQDVLLPFGSGDSVLDIDATVAGRAFRTTTPVVVETDDGPRAWVTLLDGADRLGVIGSVFDHAHDDAVHALEQIAALLAELIVARSQYGDVLAVGRRVRPLSIASELRWAMLPPQTFATDRVTIAAVVAPPYEIAGDSFDYSVNGATAHVGVFDAMGHGLEASRMANLAVGAYRHARRLGFDLVESHRHVDTAISGEFGDSKFVTAVLAELDLERGLLRVLLAGHPNPLLLRNGHAVSGIDVRPSMPLGIGDPAPSVGEVQLEPEDRVPFYSDGVIEARDGDGEPFGAERLADFLVRAQASEEPAAETMRRLGKAILEHQGAPLEDDATLLSLQWRRVDI